MPLSRLDSHQNSVQNGMVEKFTAFMATIFVPNFRFYVTATFCRPRFPKTSSSQKRSRRNSVQNAPIGIFTALTGTIFVTISVFVSRGNFQATFRQLSGNFRTTFGQPIYQFRNRYIFFLGWSMGTADMPIYLYLLNRYPISDKYENLKHALEFFPILDPPFEVF